MRRRMCIAALGLLLVACGDPAAAPITSPQPPDTVAATTTTTVTTGSLLDQVAFPTDDGGWQGDPMVDCDGLTAPLSAFGTMQPLSATPDPAVQAGIEQSALLMSDPALLDQTWYVLQRDSESIVMLAFDGEHQAELRLRSTDSGWTFDGGGTGAAVCTLRVGMPAGFGAVEWRLDPAYPTSPADTALHLLLTESACASGQPMGERLVGPRVMESSTEVRITFGAVSQESAQTCPSNPEQPFVVPLSDPLFDRTPIEGRTVGSVLDWLPFEVGPENVTLHVSNQSFADDPVHITVSIDGTVVVDQSFEVGSQHNWIPFELELEPGAHTVIATSDTGITSTFTLDVLATGHKYAVVDYWYYSPDPKYHGASQTPRSFTFDQSDEPIGFA